MFYINICDYLYKHLITKAFKMIFNFIYTQIIPILIRCSKFRFQKKCNILLIACKTNYTGCPKKCNDFEMSDRIFIQIISIAILEYSLKGFSLSYISSKLWKFLGH